jgi:hypothetical protein
MKTPALEINRACVLLSVLIVMFFSGANYTHGSGVLFSEIMYHPVDSDLGVDGDEFEFLELHNNGTNSVDITGAFFTDGITYAFTNSTLIAADGYLVLVKNRAAFESRYPGVTNIAPSVYGGKLRNEGESVTLADAATNVIFSADYDDGGSWPPEAAGRGSSLELIDPEGDPNDPLSWQASAIYLGTPGGDGEERLRTIVINEVLTHTDPPLEDAIELHNLTTNDIDVSGWYLSDDVTLRKKYRITNTVIVAGGYAVLYEYQFNDPVAPTSTTFALSSALGESVFLTAADSSSNLTYFVDDVEFGAAENGVSFGRYPNGTGPLITLESPTFGVTNPASLAAFRAGGGALNSGPKVGQIVINEIMYHPPDAGFPPQDNNADEYIELRNITGTNVPLYDLLNPTNTWRITSAVNYTFPTNVVIPTGGHILVVGTSDIGAFRTQYGLSENLPIYGPWSGQLGNNSEKVRLYKPDTPEPDMVPYVLVDFVDYNDSDPWPPAADGLGYALERNDDPGYGDDAANWHVSSFGGSPGTNNTAFVPVGSIIISEIMAVNRSTLQDEDGGFSDWIELYNTTDQEVSLNGWHLTDQVSVPTLWTFPDVSIPAHGYLIVFASQKDRTNSTSELHANFALDEAGEYLALLRDDLTVEFAFDPSFPPQSADVAYGIELLGSVIGTVIKEGSSGRYLVPTNAGALSSNWTARTFDDSAWQPAGNGIGYDNNSDYQSLIETDLHDEMYNTTESAFVRYPFSIENSAEVESMLLRAKYDDGYAAWLNGVRVTSDNADATLSWNSGAIADRSDSLAVVFADTNLTASTHLLVDGVNVLALQALNDGAGSSDLLLLPALQIQWAEQTNDLSFTAGYLSPATPGSGNGAMLPGVTPTPVLSHPGGVFSGSLSVTVTCANAEADIHYTLDGTVPTTNSPLYTAPLEFTSNAELVVRAFLTGLVDSPVVGAAYRTSFLGINEFLASNATATPEVADFSDFPDWIELYNAGTNAIDLGGYYLSDNLDEPFRWRIPNGATIPAQGHLIVWADGYDSYPGLDLTRPFWTPDRDFTTRYYHSSFKLSSEGEEVGLFTPSGSPIDTLTFGEQATDISYGRYPDGAMNWGYFGEPTAGASNQPPVLSNSYPRTAPVVIAPTNEALIVTGTVHVVLSSEPDVTEIRYTTNGTAPTSVSLLYTQAFDLVDGGVIRARAYAPNKPPSTVATRTFLRDARTPELPIISLVIDPYLLYDDVVGIFENLLKQREVPGNFQFYTTPTNMEFQIDAGFRLQGLNTFTFAQKPLNVFLKDNFGYEELAYQLFPEKPIGFFDRFVLRNGNDDWDDAFLRDTLGQLMLRDVINSDVQSFRPCAIYLNGSYYGVINIQEKMDEMYCSKNYGIELDDIDFWENDGGGSGDLLDAGTADAWNDLLDYLDDNSMTDPVHYEHVKSQVDFESLVDYVAGQVFVTDTAWNHNRKWWRERNPGGQWRWCFVDLDRALNGNNINRNQIDRMVSDQEVFRELLNNTEFRGYAAQRVMAHLSSSFSPDRILPIIDSEADRIRSEIEQHSDLYDSQGGISSLASWENEIDEIRNYASQRPAAAMQNVASYFGSGEMSQMQLDVEGGSGSVLANYVALNPGTTTVLVAGMPVQLTAQPDIGQAFVRWEIEGDLTETITIMDPGGVWRYNDSVTNDVPGWSEAAFDDSGWPSGAAQLGYGDGDEATVIDYGGNANNKLITYYFRKTVVVTNVASFTNAQISLLRDDGAVVYINGYEVWRSNMPGGTIDRTTLASGFADEPEEDQYHAYGFSPTNLIEGTNVLAVEVHQGGANSADVSFDLGLSGIRHLSSYQSTNYNEQITITPSAALIVTAVFEPTAQSLLPETVSSNLTLSAAESPYLATGDIYVPPNVSLTLEAGTTLLMPDGASIYVEGELTMLGTTGATVQVASNPEPGARLIITDTNVSNRTAFRWGCIAFDHATHTGRLYNVVLRDASLAGTDPVNMKAAISAIDSDLFMDGLDIDDVGFPVFIQDGRSAVIQNSRLRLRETGDGINLKRTQYARVENCDLSGSTAVDADAIDYDGIAEGIIRGNRIHDFMGDNNDAIDLGEGTSEVLIESNLIYNCSDKGISVGQASTGVIRGNVIVNCGQGVGIKDTGSYALIDHNTFYSNGLAVACFEKNLGRGGGSADVINSILSRATVSSYFVDALSTLNISYCLSDTEFLSGKGMIGADPLFVDVAASNFALQVKSRCINSGSPDSPYDPNGSRADMGAFPYSDLAIHPLQITEIMYHPPDRVEAGDGEDCEFITLANTGTNPLSLAGIWFSDGIQFAFDAGAALGPGEQAVMVSDQLAFAGRYPGVTVSGVYSGKLDNAGERVTIMDGGSNIIFSVGYDNNEPWYPRTDGTGYSLVAVMPGSAFDPDAPANWRESHYVDGSPGRPDEPLSAPPGSIVINEVLTFGDSAGSGDWIEIHNTTTNDVDVGNWCLSDSPNNLKKFLIPSNTVLSSGGYVAFTETTQFGTNAPGASPGFTLDELGSTVYLSSWTTNGTLAANVVFQFCDVAQSNVPFGRHRTSDDRVDFTAMSAATVAASNAYPRVGPVVISEIMYNPAPGDSYEFVELHCVSDDPVALYDASIPTNTWKLGGAVQFAFPTGVVMAANDYVLVVPTNEAAFRLAYPDVPPGVEVYGPYYGKLDNAGELLTLHMPSPEMSAVVPAPYVMMDMIRYGDDSPWPAPPDGEGPSLEKWDTERYGNDPTNWAASLRYATPGLPIEDADRDGMADEWERTHFGSITNESTGSSGGDWDGDGSLNEHEFRAGTDPTNAASVLAMVEMTTDITEAGVVISWSSVINKYYTILSSTNISTDFTNIVEDGIPADPPINAYTVNVDEVESEYYRIELDE